MPRTYHRKSNRQNWNAEHMDTALQEVLHNGMPFKTAARIFGVPLMSLKRRAKNKNVIAKDSIKHLGGKTTTFTNDQENELIRHILDLESRMYGLTTTDLRRLAFQLAEKNHIPHHFSREKQIAGYDWLAGFTKRHPEIALRNPEATSAARARGFNKQVVTKFFELLKNIIEKHNFPPHKIYNVDETSVSTVPGKNSKIFAKRGRKQVARVTSAERGVSATAVICTSAGGVFVPPMFIFSRKRMKLELMDGTPPGSIFGCNESGWMKLDMFERWFDHFLNFTKPSKEEPVLLILDGHLSHTKNLNVVTKARENSVCILCLPPHTTHKLQPLDVGVMYPLSRYMDQSLEKWMNNNPGRTVTVFQIGKIFSEAYLKAAMPSNAINAFKKTGIVPYDPDVFIDADFVAADVTDQRYDEVAERSSPSSVLNEVPHNSPARETVNHGDSLEKSPLPGPSNQLDSPIPDEVRESSFIMAPTVCHPLPKIKGKRQVRQRKSVGTVLLTSTPYKNMLEEEKLKKDEAEEKKKQNKKPKLANKENVNPKQRTKKKEKVNEISSDSDASDAECIFCCETYTNAKDGEGWIKCSKCLRWAHDACAGVEEDEDHFTCDLCQSCTSVKYKRQLF
ncbi:hypothetical protein PPYR_02285 [Photinus pyralis]|uniref:HTH CENPB-type domain-containing protein n=2 Tax=Photinus pyralis TaxID=7054 RepID=A0A5N4B6T9_PHOPY|nr:uncharacterized protein LOC116165102 [Photinus pyralis]XP_031337124.1 uncharacterized protein LOC116166333 [Photinus pyralis]XP_031337324.1 uncharacterized protein LOC116166500 [Photinus pyralis]XP_031338783.1 uncharacterized protein LOC116167536 [Photinus pyralis]KAB0805315.1 hypothetical protein PPYR_02285 [Photinus pyralis]